MTPTKPPHVMVPPQPVGERRCSNCACFYELANANPLEPAQAFCAREPAGCTPARMEVPRLDPEGRPVMSRLDPKKPMTDAVEGFVFAHRPTQPNLVCFDGWRPRAAAPGERLADVRQRELVAAAGPMLVEAAKAARLPPELIALLTATIASEAPAAAPPEALASAEPQGHS